MAPPGPAPWLAAPFADARALREGTAPLLLSEARRAWRAMIEDGALSDRPTAEGGLIPPGRAIAEVRGEEVAGATDEVEPTPAALAGEAVAVLALTAATRAVGAGTVAVAAGAAVAVAPAARAEF